MKNAEDNSENSMIGRRVGVYELRREIGRGGMGAVFLAENAAPAKSKRLMNSAREIETV